MNFSKILVVVAHPDDEVLGCGGFIDQLIKLRKKIKIIFLAEGTSCRFDNQINEKKLLKLIKTRESYAKAALKILNVKDYEFYDLKCGSLNSYPLVKINKIIENEINKFKPDTILTHNLHDCNMDHTVVHKSVMIASRPIPKTTVKNVLCFEIPSSTEWNFENPFNPNFFVDIENNIERKIKAFNKYYPTEGKKFPFPRSAKGLKTYSNFRGMSVGIKNAEAFKIMRFIKN